MIVQFHLDMCTMRASLPRQYKPHIRLCQNSIPKFCAPVYVVDRRKRKNRKKEKKKSMS